jgi:hypothetical protein
VATNGMYVRSSCLIAGVAAAFIAGSEDVRGSGPRCPVRADVRRDVCARLDLVPRSATRGWSGVRNGKGAQPAERPDAARLATLTASSRPMEIAATGYGGLVLILWLMVMKPF